MTAKDYLHWYRQAVAPFAQELFDQWLVEAAGLGSLPKILVERFYAVAFRGKQVRGALFVLGYELAGKKVTPAVLKASLSVELFHAGILVQDDIMDEDEKRRDAVALHVQFRSMGDALHAPKPQLFGESLAVCVSDFAFYASWQVLLEQPFAPKNIVQAGMLLASCIQRLAHGQAMDVANIHTKKATPQEVLQIFRYKTAEYTGVLPLLMGAALAGIHDRQKLAALETYGRSFGWAFQIQDDILGMFGDEQTGKPVGNDVRNGKQTLLMLELEKCLTQEESVRVSALIGNKQAPVADMVWLQSLIRKKGVLETVKKLGDSYSAAGKEVIGVITNKTQKKLLLNDFLDFVMARVV